MPVPERMLWVDDQIDRYGPWIEKFSQFGTDVDAAASVGEGLQKLSDNRYDVVLLDYKMGHDSCINEIPEFYEKKQNAKLFVCSSFFYIPEVMDQLGMQELDKKLHIGRIDKTNLPFTDDDNATMEFLNDLTKTNHAAGKKGEPLQDSVFDLDVHEKDLAYPSWDDYSALDASAKIEALRKAAAITIEARKIAREDGYRYLLFCGSWTTPEIKATSIEQAPTQAEVIELARTRGCAPFVFTVGGGIDDLTPRCSDINGLRGYPILSLTLRENSEEIHFDTGNPYTLLSYEWYLEKGWLPVSYMFDMHTAGDMELMGSHFRLKGIVVTDAAGRTRTVQMDGFAVIEWNKTRLATRCSHDCTTKLQGGPLVRICKFRTGLLGRNFARTIGVPIKLDCVNGSTFFCEE